MAITLVFSSLVHSSLKVHFSMAEVPYYHLRNSAFYQHSHPGCRFTRSYSTCLPQRSKYTEGVVRRMRRCVVFRTPSRKCVQKKYSLVSAKPGLWTLNSGLDYGLKYGLKYGLGWTVLELKDRINGKNRRVKLLARLAVWQPNLASFRQLAEIR